MSTSFTELNNLTSNVYINNHSTMERMLSTVTKTQKKLLGVPRKKRLLPAGRQI